MPFRRVRKLQKPMCRQPVCDRREPSERQFALSCLSKIPISPPDNTITNVANHAPESTASPATKMLADQHCGHTFERFGTVTAVTSIRPIAAAMLSLVLLRKRVSSTARITAALHAPGSILCRLIYGLSAHRYQRVNRARNRSSARCKPTSAAVRGMARCPSDDASTPTLFRRSAERPQ
jgi:hypothetical protein